VPDEQVVGCDDGQTGKDSKSTAANDTRSDGRNQWTTVDEDQGVPMGDWQHAHHGERARGRSEEKREGPSDNMPPGVRREGIAGGGGVAERDACNPTDGGDATQ